MRDGILTEESYRNVARCPPMTLNNSECCVMCGKVAKRAPAARMAARMAEHPQVTGHNPRGAF